MRILVIGLSRELPLGPADAMELADHLVKRAAAVQADGNTPGACPSQKREVAPSQLSHALAVLSACHTLTYHLSQSLFPLPAAHGQGWARLGNPGMFGFQMWKF